MLVQHAPHVLAHLFAANLALSSHFLLFLFLLQNLSDFLFSQTLLAHVPAQCLVANAEPFLRLFAQRFLRFSHHLFFLVFLGSQPISVHLMRPPLFSGYSPWHSQELHQLVGDEGSFPLQPSATSEPSASVHVKCACSSCRDVARAGVGAGKQDDEDREPHRARAASHSVCRVPVRQE